MASEYQRLLRTVAELQRQMGNLVRVGYIPKEGGIRKHQVRMVLGKDRQGKEVLGPWLDTGDHRGGAREQRFYKEGQNLVIISPGGDFSQGTILPYAPNQKHMPPDHWNKKGKDEETYQLDDLRVKKTKDGYDIWLQPPNQKQQEQKEDPSSEPKELPDQKDSGTIHSKIRLNKDGGITGRIGTNMRFMAHGKGVKIKAANKFAIFVDDKGCWSTHAIGIKKDPIPDDNS